MFKDKFLIDIVEIKPANEYNAICIIDADVDVDFAPPLDYVEPERPSQSQGGGDGNNMKKGDIFSGAGMRIDEKKGGNTRKGSTTMSAN